MPPPTTGTTPTATASATPRPGPSADERRRQDRKKALRATLHSAFLTPADLPAALGARWRQNEDLLYCSEAILDGHSWSKRQAKATSWRWLRSRDTAIGQLVSVHSTEEAADTAVAGLDEVLKACGVDSEPELQEPTQVASTQLPGAAGWSPIKGRVFEQRRCADCDQQQMFVYGRVRTSVVLMHVVVTGEVSMETGVGLYRALGERVEGAKLGAVAR